jgi:hypothetical protein
MDLKRASNTMDAQQFLTSILGLTAAENMTITTSSGMLAELKRIKGYVNACVKKGILFSPGHTG